MHVGNVPLDTSESAIRRLVARTLHIQDDQILEVSLPTNSLGKQKGYALVSFATRALAESAKDALNGIAFRGKRLKVKTDQDWQTLYPSHSPTASHGEGPSYFQHQSQQAETNNLQCGTWTSACPATSATREDGGGPGDRTAGQPSDANPAPEFIEPLVVDGSRDRNLPKSSSSKEHGDSKSKRNRGGDAMGKQKHNRH